MFRWLKHISEATEAYKCREGKSRRSELSTPEGESEPSSISQSVDSGIPAGGESTPQPDASDSVTTNETDSGQTSAESSQRNSGVMEDEENKKEELEPTHNNNNKDPTTGKLQMVHAQVHYYLPLYILFITGGDLMQSQLMM